MKILSERSTKYMFNEWEFCNVIKLLTVVPNEYKN